MARPTRPGSDDSGARSPGELRLVVQVWLLTRVSMAVVALVVVLTEGRTFAEAVGGWDVAHFLAIAQDGYQGSDIAFFPGWPLLLRGFSSLGIPALLAGVVLALAASGAAAAALVRLGGPMSAIAWLLAPTAVFTMVPYTESVFCAAAFWSWERARAGRWGWAAVLAAIAAATRVSGLFLIGALAVLALTQAGDWWRRCRRLPWLLLPSAVTAGYAWYLWTITGSWTAWYQAQADNWSRGLTWPWVSLQHTLEAIVPGAYADHPEWVWVFRAELVSMVVGLLVVAVCLARRRLAEASWVGVQVLAFATSYWFMSVNRAVLLWFPLWTQIGEAVSSTRRWTVPRQVAVGVLVVVALVVQLAWSWLFFTGRWAS